MHSKTQLKKLSKDQQIALINDLADKLDKDIPVTGNEQARIDRIIEAEKELAGAPQTESAPAQDLDAEADTSAELSDQEAEELARMGVQQADKIPAEALAFEVISYFETRTPTGAKLTFTIGDIIHHDPTSDFAQELLDKGLVKRV